MAEHNALQGKVAFVTGAGQGVGFATAQALVAEGVKVAVADIDGQAAAAAAAKLGHGAIGIELDVTDHAAYAAALDETELALGPLDILINNAGIMPLGPFEDETDATSERVVEINFHAMLFGSKQAVRRFKQRDAKGHIVNVSSGAGWVPGGGGVSYAGSKFAVVGFSESMRWELNDTGIKVSVVAPAIIKTQLGAGVNDIRGLRRITATDVANGIVKGLKKHRFVIWVPFEMGILARAMSAMPYRWRAWLAHVTKADKAMLSADRVARAGYEASIAGTGGDVVAAPRTQARSQANG